MTIFEKIKSFSAEEMAEFIRLMVDESGDAGLDLVKWLNHDVCKDGGAEG